MPHVFEIADRMHVACLGRRAAVPDPERISRSDSLAVLTGGRPPHAAGNAHDVPARLKPRGSSQGGMRQYNERVVLQAVRLQGALAGADIARQTGLTAQTVSLITKRLEADGLLLRGQPLRGKVGQPAVPLSLNPAGAYAIGIKVGRRSMDVLLVDLVGQVRRRWTLAYQYPEPGRLLAEIRKRLAEVPRQLDAASRARIQGVGIAAPLSLGGWQTLLEMPPEVAARWPGVDLAAEVAAHSPWPVHFLKDTAAACVAELVAGRGRDVRSFLYVYVDTFIGGGLVLDSQLRTGLHGNAGAIGSLPLRPAGRGGAAPAQLLSIASLVNLERRYASAGLAMDAAVDDRAMMPPWRPHTEAWLAEAASAVALAASGAACLLDMPFVIIDGSFSRGLLAALLQAVDRSLDHYSWEGVARPAVTPGLIGTDARALGGAMLPLHANFAPDQALFLKLAGA